MSLIKIDMNKRGVARVMLNRPDVHNAFNPALIDELFDMFVLLGRLSDVRVVVLTGAGKSFSAGADLGAMQAAAQADEASNRADALKMARMFEAVNACSKPVIGVVQGAALGGGLGLVACCDVAIAVPDAQFGLTETRLGLIPAVISPFVLAKIGVSAARRYMLSGERFSAAEALRLGLVHEISADPETVLAGLIGAFLAGASGAIADIKALISESIQDAEALALRIAARRASVEGREGISAFLAKRKPDWAE